MLPILLAQEAKAVLGLFSQGSVADFTVVLLLAIFVWVMVSRARTGRKVPEIRKIAGLEAVDEAIGRATEMGRPVAFWNAQ